jgi:uncharacterized OsmC-like protein
MSESIINRVRSYSSGMPGQSLNEIGPHTLRIDAPAHHGGTPEAITPADAFLAGISACGVLLVDERAREVGLPLKRVEVTIESVRSHDDPSWFINVGIRFMVTGVSQTQANELVQFYKDS